MICSLSGVAVSAGSIRASCHELWQIVTYLFSRLLSTTHNMCIFLFHRIHALVLSIQVVRWANS